MKKIQVKHDFWSRGLIYRGQDKIGGAHLRHVGIALHAYDKVASVKCDGRMDNPETLCPTGNTGPDIIQI